jgi:hypothetical protein
MIMIRAPNHYLLRKLATPTPKGSDQGVFGSLSQIPALAMIRGGFVGKPADGGENMEVYCSVFRF